ncbi:MAG: WbqC family protein [Bacteroidota bacterium]
MIANKTCLISTAYFPPIQLAGKFLSYDAIFIEKEENYLKQSYRNRCCILSANGVQILSIPVKKLETIKTKIKDIRIDYEYDSWIKIHIKSIESAYGHSPYFEYYFDDIKNIILKRTDFLYDLNLMTIELMISWIHSDAKLFHTTDFENSTDIADFRYKIHPKKRFNKKDDNFRPMSYNQVFSDRFSFIPNLSIIDLIFNEGPNAYQIIKESVV